MIEFSDLRNFTIFLARIFPRFRIKLQDILGKMEKKNFFNDVKQDYCEIETIGTIYVAQNKGCKFTHFVQPEKFLDSSIEIQRALEKICDNVRSINMDVNESKYTISAEVFGDGIDMWLRSQGDQNTSIVKRGRKWISLK